MQSAPPEQSTLHLRGQSSKHTLARHVPLHSASSSQTYEHCAPAVLQSMLHSASSSHVTLHCAPGKHRIVQLLRWRHVTSHRPVEHVKSHRLRSWHVQVGPHSPFPGPASFGPASLELPASLPPSVPAGGGLLGVDGPSESGTSSEPIVQS